MEQEVRELVDAIIDCAYQKKGEDIAVLDMQGLTLVCDAFVIINATSRPHTKAIAESIAETLNKDGYAEKRIQGLDEGSWVLLDYGSVVVHVFLENLRSFYDLEGLWSKAKIEYPYLKA